MARLRWIRPCKDAIREFYTYVLLGFQLLNGRNTLRFFSIYRHARGLRAFAISGYTGTRVAHYRTGNGGFAWSWFNRIILLSPTAASCTGFADITVSGFRDMVF
jgi:hypothetical protein